jgi:hypothetical protein
MPKIDIGMTVTANLQGMTVGGVQCGEGTLTPGTVIAIEPRTETVTVRLDSAFGGQTDVALDIWRIAPR